MNDDKITFARPLVGPEVIASAMGVSRNTVLNWANKGSIPCVKIEKTFRFSIEKVSEAIGYKIDPIYVIGKH